MVTLRHGNFSKGFLTTRIGVIFALALRVSRLIHGNKGAQFV